MYIDVRSWLYEQIWPLYLSNESWLLNGINYILGNKEVECISCCCFLSLLSNHHQGSPVPTVKVHYNTICRSRQNHVIYKLFQNYNIYLYQLMHCRPISQLPLPGKIVEKIVHLKGTIPRRLKKKSIYNKYICQIS